MESEMQDGTLRQTSSEETAIITDIQKFCVHDGPGLRTTVFFKGCPLRCIWCQNPETQSVLPQILYAQNECIGCGRCITACPNHAITAQGTSTAACTACGICTEVCCAKARVRSGRTYHIHDLLEILLQDVVFYRNTGGGVTLSGGEVLNQAPFAARLLQALRDCGVNTAIETCGYASWDKMRPVVEQCDVVLYDIKHTDPEAHKRYTGVDNRLIVENLYRTAALHKRLFVRYPLMPGVNDTQEVAGKIAALARDAGAEDVHILPFHQMGQGKWHELGKPYQCETWQTPSAGTIQAVLQAVQACGFRGNVWGYGNYA